MFWKLAISTLLLPAYFGLGAVTAKAASNSNIKSLQPVEYSAIQQPQYYANYNPNDCNDNNSGSGYRRTSYYPQRSYYHNSYHPQHHSNGYHQNSYHPQHHNSGYHQNSYHPQHHNSGYHQNSYHPQYHNNHQNYGHDNYYNH